MSHTSTIDGIVITDIEALKAAIKELKSNGINCELLENAVPRAYYQNQSGMEKAPYVVGLKDARYDVGLYPSGTGKGFEARTDLFAGSVHEVLGETGDYSPKGSLAKLNKLYAVHAATRQAIKKGYTVRRINKDDGSIQLRVAVNG